MTQLLPAAWQPSPFLIDEAEGRKGDGDFTWNLTFLSHLRGEALLLGVWYAPGSTCWAGARQASLSLKPESCPGLVTSREGELGSPGRACTTPLGQLSSSGSFLPWWEGLCGFHKPMPAWASSYLLAIPSQSPARWSSSQSSPCGCFSASYPTLFSLSYSLFT